jgi:phage terminase large subunit
MQITRRIRTYQQPFHKYLTTTPGARAIGIWHRRAGKDEVCLAATCELAHKRIGSYWHCLPEYAQGRKALWTAINAQTGKRRIDEAFPQEIRENTNDTEMFIRLKCGSTWQVIGSDRYDSTVGAGVAGVVYSEWALANPSAWAYHRPMVEENGGWAAFITTPRGRNHAYNMFNMAQKNPRWFAEKLSVHDTGALTDEALEESLKEYIAIYGEDQGRAHFEQEYECSFNAAILGAFYGREMALIRQQHRIGAVEAVPWKPVHTAWDIGVRDDTSIWFFQVIGGRLFILDCYTDNGGPGIEHYANIVKERTEALGCQHGTAFVPHDAKVKEWLSGKTRIEEMVRLGLNPKLCVNASKLDGINAARLTLQRAVFHDRCEAEGIAALEQYRREWDDDKKAFKATEVHDWSSHLSDAFRYLALSWKVIPDVVIPERKEEPPQGYFRPPPVSQPSNGRIKV